MTPYATIFQSTLLVKKHSCATGGTPPLVMAAGGALSKSPRLSPRASDHFRGVTKMVRRVRQSRMSTRERVAVQQAWLAQASRRCPSGGEAGAVLR